VLLHQAIIFKGEGLARDSPSNISV